MSVPRSPLTLGRQDKSFRTVSQFNVDTLPMQHSRVRICLEDWEPDNDDDDPRTFYWPSFYDEGFNQGVFQFMQMAQQQGMILVASIREVPDWIVSNPESSRQRYIPFEMYPEMIESLAAWLLTARDESGYVLLHHSLASTLAHHLKRDDCHGRGGA